MKLHKKDYERSVYILNGPPKIDKYCICEIDYFSDYQEVLWLGDNSRYRGIHYEYNKIPVLILKEKNGHAYEIFKTTVGQPIIRILGAP